jgi:hypothetical protein
VDIPVVAAGALALLQAATALTDRVLDPSRKRSLFARLWVYAGVDWAHAREGFRARGRP